MTSASIRAGAAFPAVADSSKPASALPRRAHRTGLVVAALLAGNLLAAAAVIAIAQPDVRLLADPELARLLRGMALIKATIVLPVLALLAWRFRSPITPRLGLAYALAAFAMSAATAMIWQLSAIAPAALLFHGGALTMILLAWRDGMPRSRLASLMRHREAAPGRAQPSA